MRTGTFIALAAVTVIVAGGAWYAVQQREPAPAEALDRARLFPTLDARVNDVTRVVVRSAADGTITLERRDQRWVAAEEGYPADFEKIRPLLLGIARLETIEPRTSRPELYDRLALQDVEKEGSGSVRVTVMVGDETVADVLIGRARMEKDGGGVFVRRAGEPQAWLAAGKLAPSTKPVQWLERNIANVDQRRVRRVEIRHPDGESVVVEKTDPADETFTLATPVPGGRVVGPAHELSAVASITDFLILEDVRPASEVSFPEPSLTAEFLTFDGLKLTARATEQDDRTWVVFAAEPVDPAPEAAGFVEENAGKDSAAGRTADQLQTAEEVAKQAADINARTEGWAYRLTDYKTGKLRTRLADITEEPKPEETEKEETEKEETEKEETEKEAPPAPTSTN